MTTKERAPNMYDVARLAQVSHQTVSRVINNQPGTREETRQRVLDAMEELGYRPNRVARALASSRSRMIGIVVSDLELFGPSGMMRAMELSARALDYFAVTCTIDPHSDDSVTEGVNQLTELGVDGIVMITPRTEAVTTARKALRKIPIVTVDSMYRVDELAVSVDNFQGGQIATDYLVSLGHRDILHVSGPPTWFEATARASGYTAAMRTAGLVPRIVEGDWTSESGYEIGITLDLDAHGTTAVFAANDEMCIGILHAMWDRGIDVPSRLSVMGFDDVPQAAYMNPPLTTMRQDFGELGRRAIELLTSTMEGLRPHAPEVIVPSLIERSSTARPSATGQ